MNIDIGAMDSRIGIYRKVDTEIDSLGEINDKYILECNIWAEVNTTRGSEKMKATGMISRENTIKVVTRFRRDVDCTCKVEYLGKMYEIYSIGTLGRNEYIEMMCLLQEDN